MQIREPEDEREYVSLQPSGFINILKICRIEHVARSLKKVFSLQDFVLPKAFLCDSQHFKFSMEEDLSADIIKHVTSMLKWRRDNGHLGAKTGGIGIVTHLLYI